MKWLATTLLCLLILTAGFVFAKDEKKPPAPTSLQELEKEIRKVMAEKHVPGVSIAIVNRDQVLWYGPLGLADVAAKTPVTPDTLFRIGSTTKGFVSLSVLQLVEQGKLKLEDPIHKWAPEVEFTNPWEKTDPIRIVHVLEHATGFDDIALREYAHNEPDPIRLRDGLALNPKSRKSRWRPGTRVSYCNSGPPIAAYVVEKVTGQTFEDYVQKNLFDPLQMSTASYFLTPEVEQRLTKLYQTDGTTTYPYWHISMRPSGSINASAREMGNYVQMYLNRGSFNGQQIVQTASLERMERPESTYAARAGIVAGYGLSNYTTPYKSFIFHGHNGGVEGGLTEMSYLPEHGIGFIMMMNSGDGSAYTEINNMIRSFIIRDLPKPSLPSASNITADLAAKYDGWYEPISPRVQMLQFLERLAGMVRVRVDDKKFVMQSLGRTREYVAVKDLLLREKETPVATLALIPDAEEGIVIQGMMSTFRRIPTAQAILQIALPVLVLLLMVSSVLFALIWIPRKVFGRMRDVPLLRVRFIPLIAVLSLAAFVLLMLYGTDNIMLLGRVTWLSVTIFGLTLLFGLASIWGLIVAVRARKSVRRSVAIHSLLVALACTIAAIYLAYWGIIGLRTWG